MTVEVFPLALPGEAFGMAFWNRIIHAGDDEESGVQYEQGSDTMYRLQARSGSSTLPRRPAQGLAKCQTSEAPHMRHREQGHHPNWTCECNLQALLARVSSVCLPLPVLMPFGWSWPSFLCKCLLAL